MSDQPETDGAAAVEIRIEWRLNGLAGGCPWRLKTDAVLASFERQVAMCCAEFGEGTHWIAERPA
ncbi:hypothetical protein [Azohydromonas aeria]|uniref:hypothetical protein n=1 Tax=Azohydromonas aeria TaxID=2590212 RepID=UPI0012FC74A0|nr:hypothetical protein [Azohydromonas aeria]